MCLTSEAKSSARPRRFGKGVCEDRLYDQHFLVHGKTATLRHDYIDVVASDVATWTSRPLDRDLVVTGELAADISASTSGTEKVIQAPYRG